MAADFTVQGSAMGLIDRDAERDTLDRLVAVVRAGESRALVVSGEAGVGKSELLDYLAANASGCRIASITTDESGNRNKARPLRNPHATWRGQIRRSGKVEQRL